MRALRARSRFRRVVVATTICLAGVITLDLLAPIVVAGEPPRECTSAAIAASSVQAHARVRQPASYRMPRIVESHAVATVPGHAWLEPAWPAVSSALTNRERLAHLTILRI